MSINYRHCYELLELDFSADWEMLRKNYKHLVQQHHPDRFEQNPDAKEKAEAQLRELNHAYKALVDYHRTHHRLPFGKAPAKSHENWLFLNTAGLESRDEENGGNPRRSSLAMNVSKWMVLGVPIGLVVAVFGIMVNEFNEREVETEMLPDTQIAARQKEGQSLRDIKPRPTFHYGDSKARVLEVQGKPDQTVGESWFYGKSRVDFLQGHVSHWDVEKGFPLRVSGTFPGKKQRFFYLGSSKEDVLSIQGEPVVKTRRRWDYGASFIEFEDDRVVAWYSSVLRPLAVRKKEKKQ